MFDIALLWLFCADEEDRDDGSAGSSYDADQSRFDESRDVRTPVEGLVKEVDGDIVVQVLWWHSTLAILFVYKYY